MPPDLMPETPSNQPPEDAAQRIAGWMIVLLWVLGLAGATWMAQGWLDSRAAARAPEWSTDSGGAHSLTLQSDRYGQYALVGGANDRSVTFLIDTGATGISIPGAIAEKLNLKRGRAMTVLTANGETTVYATKLRSLSIGPFVRRNVQAHINPSMDAGVALLGMEFLRHYELLQRDGELTISLP